MIKFENISKSFPTPRGRKIILQNTNFVFPTGKAVGLMGRNGAGKSTLMQMISGKIRPDTGTITHTGTMSWPVGFAGSFNREMTGAQNTKFIARTYGIDTQSLADYVEDFTELGHHFHAPIRNYSSGMRSRLAFAISIGIPFDIYLVDEVTAVGDASFKRKSRIAFQDRMKKSSAIVVTHSTRQILKICDAGAVLENGKLQYYEDVKEAISKHHKNMGSDEDE
jgi:capsular polysaccharide transport system ATP-binding protein